MSTEDDSGKNGWALIAKAIVDKLPIEDILEPGAKPAGELAADLIRTIQLATFPLQLAGIAQERFRRFINRSLRGVPEEDRIAPPPQILGPILEGIRYEPEGTPIDEMFAELLSRSMDAKRAHEAHPAFPLLIRQISADEAQVLDEIHSEPALLRLVTRLPYDDRIHEFLPSGRTVIVDDLPRARLKFTHNVPFYIEHLTQLGLVITPQVGNQIPLYDKGLNQPQTGVEIRGEYRLTETGIRFMTACKPCRPSE